MVENKLSSSRALRTLGAENPFSIETIRARRQLRFPEVDPTSLNRRERAIYQKAREDCLALGFTSLKGAFAVAETAALEDLTSERFLSVSTRMALRLRAAHAICPNEDFQALQTVFSVEGGKRMGGAMAALVDIAELGMADIAQRPLSLVEERSLLSRLFSGRR